MELKPCPFCGTKIVSIEVDGLYRYVQCGNMDCQASGKVFTFLVDAGNANHIVANNWNNRPLESALLEAAKALVDVVYSGNNDDPIFEQVNTLISAIALMEGKEIE